MSSAEQRLGLRETTALVVGAVIGADLYICAGYGTRYLGPGGVLAWAAAAGVALSVALALAQCAARVPLNGGPYAYASAALGPFWGYIAGWAQLAAELLALAAYPTALLRYLPSTSQLFPGAALLFPTLVVVMLTVVNYFGTLSAARFHTALTLAKLLPLLLFVILGSLHLLLQPEGLGINLHPFLPHGLHHFGEALVLVFWAYAGFEHATFPAQEIREPGRTLPLALIFGLGIATVVYLSVSLLIAVALPAAELSDSPNPLGEAFTHLVAVLFPSLTGLAGWIITAGALLSILGADEAGTLTTAWLIFALAADGYLPSFLTRLHPRHRTPYLALLVQNALVLVASLLLPLENLIRVTTFLLGVTYLLSCVAAVKLASRQRVRGFLGSRYLAYPGIASSFLLLSQVRGPEIILGTLMLASALIGRLALGSSARVNRFRYTRFPEYHSGIAAALQYRFLAQTYLWLTTPGTKRSSRQEKREA